jgi:hypothetical protein
MLLETAALPMDVVGAVVLALGLLAVVGWTALLYR